MNTLVASEFEILKETMALKTQLLALLQDSHLGERLGGKSMSIAELCKEMGEVQQMYSNSFRSFKMDWGYRYAEQDVLTSVAALKAWNEQLDADLFAAIASVSNEDIENKSIDRGGYNLNPYLQLHVYREAILIFCAKVSIYLRALDIEFPEQWRYWIG